MVFRDQGCSFGEIRIEVDENLTKGSISKFFKTYKEIYLLQNKTGNDKKRYTISGDRRIEN